VALHVLLDGLAGGAAAALLGPDGRRDHVRVGGVGRRPPRRRGPLGFGGRSWDRSRALRHGQHRAPRCPATLCLVWDTHTGGSGGELWQRSRSWWWWWWRCWWWQRWWRWWWRCRLRGRARRRQPLKARRGPRGGLPSVRGSPPPSAGVPESVCRPLPLPPPRPDPGWDGEGHREGHTGGVTAGRGGALGGDTGWGHWGTLESAWGQWEDREGHGRDAGNNIKTRGETFRGGRWGSGRDTQGETQGETSGTRRDTGKDIRVTRRDTRGDTGGGTPRRKEGAWASKQAQQQYPAAQCPCPPPLLPTRSFGDPSPALLCAGEGHK